MKVFAALDLGTNNCRLLLAQSDGPRYKTIYSYSRLVRLGEGVGQSGRLNSAAMERAIATLSVCANKIQGFRPFHTRYVATAACRIAENREHFVARVQQETGLELEIISPCQEASLAMSACVPVFDTRCSHALILDIGGGSTEVIWMSVNEAGSPELLDWMSIPFGVVTLAERNCDHSEDLQTYKQVVQEVKGLLMPFEASNRIAGKIVEGKVQVIGMSGAIATLSAISLNLDEHDSAKIDGSWMSLGEVSRACHKIRTMGYYGRVEHPCIGSGRADLIIPGCAILEAALKVWPSCSMCVADRSLADGLVVSMMASTAKELGV